MHADWKPFEMHDKFSPATVYRYFEQDGELMYVGKTWSFGERDAAHRFRGGWRNRAAFACTEEYISEDLALVAEAVLIRDFQPPFNRDKGRFPRVYVGMTRWFAPEATSVSGVDFQWWRCPPGLYALPEKCDAPEWADVEPVTMEVLRSAG